MTKLRVCTIFSGIGMQERGIFNSNYEDVEIVGTSDVDKDAILSYSAIHNGLTPELIENFDNYPSIETMVQDLKLKNIGFVFEKGTPYNWDKLSKRKNLTLLKKYWLAVHLSNNLGDISKVKRLPVSDLLTFSFPCTDISNAGEQKGVSYQDWLNGQTTRSGLVWEVIRLLKVSKQFNELPKYLLMENVGALVSKKFIDEFNYLNKLIDDIGYNVYWKIIDAKNVLMSVFLIVNFINKQVMELLHLASNLL